LVDAFASLRVLEERSDVPCSGLSFSSFLLESDGVMSERLTLRILGWTVGGIVGLIVILNAVTLASP
jgi:hypothetical protein